MPVLQPRLDDALTALENATRNVQDVFQLEITDHPNTSLETAGATLTKLDVIERILTEIRRDVERPIGTSANASTQNTGLNKGNIKSIQDAHSLTSESQYQSEKAHAAAQQKRFTRARVRAANPNTPPPSPRTNSKRARLENENKELKQQVNRLENRVSALENALVQHQIPLPI